ncbi:MAG: pantetheine-phosphate adenylyltransferase [Gammaproteobacteria bacterium]|nr:pantetheine-phosphate adenylyltransferase [Gammaproteobacteria bacterium]MCP4091706.1 pantetheine-phosphate adenylyltransferase [Gammaproteobacteria bacterium]MCP4275013.1 pantetheine-phosphate adenylyltransferase [Gammaproteobacteria bacterium]MCP4831836.1 pantetheine-phosphate adenylyltransferase [Gammaproteobacteria bacterium]MCP4929772.1 pantetheine-phosphate adenylyltransferase [Gammaproteobacteria bacterium]
MAAGALYPGTFDPFTNGHEEIARRISRTFGRVVVAVAASSKKQPVFNLEKRISLIKTVLNDVSDLEVIGYEGLTVEVARQHDTGIIVRGLRAVSDFEYEFQLATMNRHLESAVETVFMTPTEKFAFVSSTLVREIAAMGGDVAKFVHPQVDVELKKHFSK